MVQEFDIIRQEVSFTWSTKINLDSRYSDIDGEIESDVFNFKNFTCQIVFYIVDDEFIHFILKKLSGFSDNSTFTSLLYLKTDTKFRNLACYQKCSFPTESENLMLCFPYESEELMLCFMEVVELVHLVPEVLRSGTDVKTSDKIKGYK